MLQLSLWVATLVTSNLVPVVSLLGVVGNALNVAVFFRQGLNVCLFSLALADLVVSTLYFLIYVEAVVGQFHRLAHLQHVRFTPLSTYVTTKLSGESGSLSVCL